jgi:hypothetical protein
MDAEKPEGNYVALLSENEDAVVYLAHMQKGSVAVKEGSVVKEGQLIGLVGNSGNTTGHTCISMLKKMEKVFQLSLMEIFL